MGTKPPAAVDERTSKDGRHDSNAASLLLTTTSSLQGRAGGSVFTPKLIEFVFGLGLTWRAEKPSSRVACTAVAAPSVRSRVLVSAGPSASMVRRGCRASCSRHSESCSKSLVILSNLISCCFERFLTFQYSSVSAGWPNPIFSSWWTGPLPSETVLLSFRSILGKPQY